MILCSVLDVSRMKGLGGFRLEQGLPVAWLQNAAGRAALPRRLQGTATRAARVLYVKCN